MKNYLAKKRIQREWYLWSKVQGPRSLLAPPPAHIIGGLEGIPAGRQGIQLDKTLFCVHFDYRSVGLSP